MTEFDNQINSRVESKEVSHKYGEVKKMSTQQLYRNYKKWMQEKKPGEVIMPFKHWIVWAKKNGVVKSFAADGGGREEVQDEKVTKIVKRSGRSVAVVMILLGVGFLAMNFVSFSSNNNNNSQQLKK